MRQVCRYLPNTSVQDNRSALRVWGFSRAFGGIGAMVWMELLVGEAGLGAYFPMQNVLSVDNQCFVIFVVPMRYEYVPSLSF